MSTIQFDPQWFSEQQLALDDRIAACKILRDATREAKPMHQAYSPGDHLAAGAWQQAIAELIQAVDDCSETISYGAGGYSDGVTALGAMRAAIEQTHADYAGVEARNVATATDPRYAEKAE